MEKVSVQEAVARVIRDMPAIAKDADFSGSGVHYKYRGIEAITAHLQPLLAQHGVVIVPFTRLISIQPALDAKPGWYDAVIETTWTITGPDGSQLEAQTLGIGRDNSDKATNKAASQAYKYLLLQLFCVADKADDTDGIDNYGAIAEQPTAEELEEDRLKLEKAAAVKALYERIKNSKGTPCEEALKASAKDNNTSLAEKALAADEMWFEIVKAILDEHGIPEKQEEKANG